MKTFSENVLSVDEAKTALRCMRLGDLSEEEALDCLDDLVLRLRNVTMAVIVEEIIENELTPMQTKVMKLFLYDGMGVAEIGRAIGLSQAAVSKLVLRANKTIERLMTPLIKYQSDIADAEFIPIKLSRLKEICAARNASTSLFCEALRNLRVAYDIGTKQMASNLKISEWELASIEKGNRLISASLAMRYSVLFNVEIVMKFKNGRGFYSCERA